MCFLMSEVPLYTTDSLGRAVGRVDRVPVPGARAVGVALAFLHVPRHLPEH